MMAAFALSYQGLTGRDIRHIYSYRAREAFVLAPRPLGGSSQFLPVPLARRWPPRFYDYYPAFGMGLPRAPAFQRLSALQVQRMLQRLSRPIACQRDPPRRHREPGSKEQQQQQQPARSRRSEAKVVRFQGPAEGDSSPASSADGAGDDGRAAAGDQGHGESAASVVGAQRSQVKVREESQGQGVKVKSEKLPELSGRKGGREKARAARERGGRKGGARLTLPPIDH